MVARGLQLEFLAGLEDGSVCLVVSQIFGQRAFARFGEGASITSFYCLGLRLTENCTCGISLRHRFLTSLHKFYTVRGDVTVLMPAIPCIIMPTIRNHIVSQIWDSIPELIPCGLEDISHAERPLRCPRRASCVPTPLRTGRPQQKLQRDGGSSGSCCEE